MMGDRPRASMISTGFYLTGVLFMVPSALLIYLVIADTDTQVFVAGAAVGLIISLPTFFLGALIALFGGFVQIVSDIKWKLFEVKSEDSNA